MALKIITAEEAASYIKHNDNIGFSGFTAAGSPKAVSKALAAIAKGEHDAGREFEVGIFTGASTGDSLDGELARANAIKFRTPYQSNKDMRAALNTDNAQYFDYHLSQLAQDLRYGFLGKVNVAIIEACDVSEDGEIVLTSAVGISPTVCQLADIIIIERNNRQPKELKGLHDIYLPLDPPNRREIPIYKPSDRIGSPVVKVDPKKIVGIVETDLPDEVGGFSPLDATTLKLGENVANFLAAELKAGRIPESFLPIQSGVGNIANAVLFGLGDHPEIPAFEMYTEVIQDAVIDLMKKDQCKFASGCSLTLSPPVLKDVYDNLDFFKSRIVLRNQEITNNPEIVRRLGLITINTALEADIFGNINSTHVVGTKMMNGIGGSGDFTRNAYMSIFVTPSSAKSGAISSFVPMVAHMDHSEHSVKIIITENGVADLRGKSPIQRAHEIIENCVHKDYQQSLRDYLNLGQKGHTPQNLNACMAFHTQFNKTGDMRNVNWADYVE